MTPHNYIINELEKLKVFEPRRVDKDKVADEIFKLLMSKKFRKYAANIELTETIRNAISHKVASNEPLSIIFPHGAYKLWRLEQAPLPDWAELFTDMYYTKWLKPICEIYEPGVWFDYYVDDLIVPKINNISLEDVEAYIKEDRQILAFLSAYQPKNFKMTITPFASVWKSENSFDQELSERISALAKTNPEFTDEDLKSVELNVKPSAEQLKDPDWKKKVKIIHDAYIPMKRGVAYYSDPLKIRTFCQPLSSGKFLIVGTTKTSIAKFWVGIGALRKNREEYQECVLSPQQIEKATLIKENISIEGLPGKNFQSIQVFE